MTTQPSSAVAALRLFLGSAAGVGARPQGGAAQPAPAL